MDKESFAQNVVASEQTLYRISKTILFNECDCEDAVQEAILKAYKKLGTLKEDRYFKTWLIRIMINECYKINKTEHFDVTLQDYQSLNLSENSDLSHELINAIMGLKPKVRVTVVLHYVEGYSVEEIKSILKVPSGTIKSRLSCGREQLKKYLEE